MKIRVNTNPLFYILLFVSMLDCGLFYAFNIPILADTGISATLVPFIGILVFVYCFMNKKIQEFITTSNIRFINFYLVVILLFIIAVSIYSYFEYHQGFYELFICFRPFLSLFMVWPYFYILSKKDGVQNLINALLIMVMFYMIVETLVALIYNFTGVVVLENMAFGIRYSRFRGTTPPLITLAFPYITYMMFKETNLKKKLMWLGGFAFTAFYLMYVCMTRMHIIAFLIMLLVMYLYRPRPLTNRLIVIAFVLIAAILLIYSGAITSFIETFDENNDQTGASTLARKIAVEYFTKYTDRNPYFSMGFVCPTTDHFQLIFRGPDENCSFDDLGIRNMWYHYGVAGVILAALISVRIIYLFIKLFFVKKTENRYLFLCLFTYLVASQVSLCAFDNQRIYSLAVIWALFEFEARPKSRTRPNESKRVISNIHIR